MGKELLQGYYNNEETGGISTFSVVVDDGYLDKSVCKNIEEVGDNYPNLLEITDFDSPEIIRWKERENEEALREYREEQEQKRNKQKDEMYLHLDDDLYETISDESIAWEIQKERDEEEERSNKKREKKSKKAQVCAGDGKQRRKNDYYATPKEAMDSLFEKITIDPQDVILEPCSGQGFISKYLELMRLNVISTELNEFSMVTDDYGETFKPVKNYGVTGIDFLTNDIFVYLGENGYEYKDDGCIDTIITNPPFSYDIDFVLQSFNVARKRVIMLLKLNALSTQIRRNLLWNDGYIDIEELIKLEPKKYLRYEKYFKGHPINNFNLKNIFIIPYRLLFDGYNNNTPLEFMWVEWENNARMDEANISWCKNRKGK